MYFECSKILLMLINVIGKFIVVIVKLEVIYVVFTSDSNMEVIVSSVVGSIKGNISDGIFFIG